MLIKTTISYKAVVYKNKGVEFFHHSDILAVHNQKKYCAILTTSELLVFRLKKNNDIPELDTFIKELLKRLGDEEKNQEFAESLW